MKRCGMLTMHRTTNFGSCLQTYGLYRAIEKCGVEYDLIDYRCPAIERREGVAPSKIISVKELIKQIIYQPVTDRKYKNIMSFLTGKVRMSRTYTPETIVDANDDYDTFLIGSDIVWGTDITENDYNYFLEFAGENKNKLAFASSVGSYGLQDSEIKGELLSKFNQIAVREKAAADWVYAISGKKADWVCDPTMLLTDEEWNEIIKPKVYKSDYVLVYFTDDKGKSLEDAKAYAHKHGLKVKCINYGIRPIKGVQSVRPATLSEFVGLIRSARFVCTASYHGMLFALYYHKDFQFYTRAHSDRVVSLAEKLEVTETCGDNRCIEQYCPVDYTQVEKKIQAFREESIAILKGMLRS